MSEGDNERRIKPFVNFNYFEETCNFTECLGGPIDFIDVYNNVKMEKQKQELEKELLEFYADHDIDPAEEEAKKLEEYLALQEEERYHNYQSSVNYYSSSDSENEY